MNTLGFRQIHLDFHTSEYISQIAKDFDKNKFGETLLNAHVDSITCFARCHHGWLYYPSRRFEHLVHPQLNYRNLLIDQIDACHERGIKAPIYTTVQWDGRIMQHYPDWLARDEKGEYIDTQKIGEPHFYNTICLNSPYRQFFIDHILDIIDVLGVERIDGFFMDILFTVDCCCSHCQQEMTRLQIDYTNQSDRLAYSQQMLNAFKREVSDIIIKRVPNASVFYNSSHVGYATKKDFSAYTHLELESLPSGGWGYDHFPITARYARNLKLPMVGMTGKFHTYWGDFHSLKNKAALEYECFLMLAMGAGCSIGDQLHPYGVLSEAAYLQIGDVYRSVSKKQPYCQNAVSKASVAVLNPEEFYTANEFNLGLDSSIIGCCRILTELCIQFDIVDSEMLLDKYTLIIVPDGICYTEILEKRLFEYLNAGGKIISAHKPMEDTDFVSRVFPITYKGPSKYDREFILPNDILGRNLPKEPFVCYLKGYDINAYSGDILLKKCVPFFNREGRTFCSHQHAPAKALSDYPAVVGDQKVAYIAFPIFSLVRKNAPLWCKLILRDLMALYLKRPLLQHDGPSTLQAMVMADQQEPREVIHLLHYITEKKSQDIYTIEDIIPLYNVNISYTIGDKKVKRLWNLLTESEILFDVIDDYIIFKVSKIEGHTMIIIDF